MQPKSIQEILAIQDPDGFSLAITDWIWRSALDFNDMPDAQQVVYCISMLEMEVNNGGFEQFFYNSSGDTVPETVSALQSVGAGRCRDLLRQAIAFFPGGEPPRNREDRQARLAEANEKARSGWSALDQEFYAYPDNLALLLRDFVLKNRNQFLRDPRRS